MAEFFLSTFLFRQIFTFELDISCIPFPFPSTKRFPLEALRILAQRQAFPPLSRSPN